MYRRRLLQGACGVGTLGFAGCSGLLGGTDSTDEAEPDDDETEVTETGTAPADDETGAESEADGPEMAGISESFEGAGLPATLSVTSQANAPPVALTEAHANSGDQSLRLASEPGTSSRVSLATGQPQADVSSVGMALRRLDTPTEESQLTYPTVDGEPSARTGDIVTDGDEHATALELRHDETSARVRIGVNPYFGDVRLRTFNADSGDAVETISVASTPLAEGFHDLSLEIDGDTVVGRLDDQSGSAPLPAALTTGSVVPRIAANAWGNGDEIAVAVDDFDVSHS